MKKLLLVFCFFSFLFATSYGTEKYTEQNTATEQEIIVDQPSQSFEDVSKEDLKKVKKESKIKKFFKKLNPFKKKSSADFGLYLIAFFLGFLLGPIGALITFLIFLKHENRRTIMRFAWLGWLWWLVIFSIIIAFA